METHMETKKDMKLAEIAHDVCAEIRTSTEYNMTEYKQLNKCQATVMTFTRKDTDITYHILQSYQTPVAIISYIIGAANCVSFARIAYGRQTATTTQHIYKFMKLYNVQHYYHD